MSTQEEKLAGIAGRTECCLLEGVSHAMATWLLLILCCLGVTAVKAQIPVTDVASITQSALNEVQTLARLAQQIGQMEQELRLAEQTMRSLSGFRATGQAFLENGAIRQALSFGTANNLSRLLATGLNGGSPAAQDLYRRARPVPCSTWLGASDSLAACQAPTMLNASLADSLNQSVARAQARAGQLQGLGAEVDGTTDAKASADLEARIAAEQTNLIAEKTMLDGAVELKRAQWQLAQIHQAAIGVQLLTQTGRSCYTCP